MGSSWVQMNAKADVKTWRSDGLNHGPDKVLHPFLYIGSPQVSMGSPHHCSAPFGGWGLCTFYFLFVGRERDMLLRRCSGSPSLLLQIQFLPCFRSLLCGVWYLGTFSRRANSIEMLVDPDGLGRKRGCLAIAC